MVADDNERSLPSWWTKDLQKDIFEGSPSKP